jgi:hypothetical protein
MNASPLSTCARALLLACGLAMPAAASIEPILYSAGPIPGVPGATIWQTGLYRPVSSPDKSRWVMRVNRTSGNDDEYLVSGTGLTGTATIFGTGGSNATNRVFFLSERGYSINDSGQIALSGSVSSRASTDTIWRYTPANGPSPEVIELVARELDAAFIQPTAGQDQFRTDIGGPQMVNTGEVVFPMSDTRSETSDRDAIFLWNGTPNSYVELIAEGASLADPALAPRVLEDINTPEANATPLRNSVQFFRNSTSQAPIFGFWGDITGTTTDDKALFRSTAAGLEIAYREGTTVDGVLLNSTTSVVGWLDQLGNSYGVSGGAFGTPVTMYAFINGTKVLNAGELVGGSVSGETWNTGPTTLLTSSVFALDRNALGGYVVGAGTNNADAARNQVVIYVAPNGTRTELLRKGDTVTVDLNGSPEVRTITEFSQQDAGFASFLTDTHFYFLAGTTPLAGSIPSDLFARIALPASNPCPNASDIAGPGPTAGADGELTADDIILFINAFTANNLTIADIAGPGPSVGADGELTADDIILFITRFTAGC